MHMKRKKMSTWTSKFILKPNLKTVNWTVKNWKLVFWWWISFHYLNLLLSTHHTANSLLIKVSIHFRSSRLCPIVNFTLAVSLSQSEIEVNWGIFGLLCSNPCLSCWYKKLFQLSVTYFAKVSWQCCKMTCTWMLVLYSEFHLENYDGPQGLRNLFPCRKVTFSSGL